jgi:ATP-dependent RNA helicase RhlE
MEGAKKVMTFESLQLKPEFLKALDGLGFQKPTPIQELAIPPLLEGRDVLAAAATGSGKTAAFLLPILQRLMDKPRGVTRVLVLTPTRELAAQIADHLRELARHTHMKGAAVYGGVGMEPQVRAFKRGVDVIIATPGRLLDHFQYPYARLKDLEVIVLDEADRMLDMGFLPDVRRILKALPNQRQTLLFSATLPQPIVDLAKDMLRDPVPLNIERKSAPAEGITHVAYPVPHELKSTLLLELLKREAPHSVLAFTRTKHRANRLADFLEKKGVSCARIHGNRSQAQRTEAMNGFKQGKFKVLVATDIAARGIDVESLGWVVNFDVPPMAEDYIHRVGRTARAEATGHAYTLVSPDEESNLHTIERHLGNRLPRLKIEGFEYDRKPAERLEIPLPERIAAIRARKAEERARAKAKAQTKPERKPEAKAQSAAPNQGADGQRDGRPPRRKRRRPSGGERPRAPQGGERPRAQQGGDRPHAPQGEVDGNRIQPVAAAGRPANKKWQRGKSGDRRGQGGHPPRQGGGEGGSSHPRRTVPFDTPFTFVRSSLIPDGRENRPLPDTRGKRAEPGKSHKDEQGGRSHWARDWKRKKDSEEQNP